jgi:hypothetical protein
MREAMKTKTASLMRSIWRALSLKSRRITKYTAKQMAKTIPAKKKKPDQKAPKM